MYFIVTYNSEIKGRWMLFILWDNTRFTSIYIIPYSNKYRQVYYWYTTRLFKKHFLSYLWGIMVANLIFSWFMVHLYYIARFYIDAVTISLFPFAQNKPGWQLFIYSEHVKILNVHLIMLRAKSTVPPVTTLHTSFSSTEPLPCVNAPWSRNRVVPMTAVTMPKIA